MNFNDYLIEDNVTESYIEKFLKHKQKVGKMIRKINEKISSDPLKSMSVVKIINAVYRALKAKGASMCTDKKMQSKFKVNHQVPKGLSQGKYTINGTVFLFNGKENTITWNLWLDTISYLDKTGNEITLSQQEIRDLIFSQAPKNRH